MTRTGIVCSVLFQLVLWFGQPHLLRAEVEEENRILTARAIAHPPVVDGMLNDEAWQEAPIQLPEWRTYNPLFGDTIEQKTEIWITYDKANIYFAFRCLDPEPDKIKTSISRRDTIFNDDYIGMSLDAMGNGQNAYKMMVNPSGIQADLKYGANSGEYSTPDWVWESAGIRTEHGYNVEIRLPFKSIRFKSGDEVRMGIIFFRKVSRLGLSVSWPHLPPGESWMARHSPLHLRDVEQPLILETIPSLTYGLNQKRNTQGQWDDPDSKIDAGLTVKYGITSSVTLDGTVNPDFSQVESDAFQVEVNQRYPVFHSEKRPFFMEGMGNFDLAGSGGDGNMWTAVHTRRIVDPLYGFKLTGTLGRFTFATLSASDQIEDASDSDERKTFNVARSLFSIGKGSYAGALFTDTEFSGGHNRVTAVDTRIQLGKNHNWSATVLNSDTLSPEGTTRNGMAGQTGYNYSTKRYIFQLQVEHYDRDFQMDTAFYNRTGFTSGWLFSSINFYPDAKRYPWLKRFSPFVWARHGKDRAQRGTEQYAILGLQASFTRQGWFRVDTSMGREPWAGRTFFVRRTQLMGNAQLTGWLRLNASMHLSRAVFYDAINPFSGHSSTRYIEAMLQPDEKFSQNISYRRIRFDRISSGARVYAVDIINTRTVYQFDRHLFLRAILQYDSSRARVLADFVASYELVPGTVFHAGYGSLFERESPASGSGGGDYINTQRSAFFKLSYLFRF